VVAEGMKPMEEGAEKEVKKHQSPAIGKRNKQVGEKGQSDDPLMPDKQRFDARLLQTLASLDSKIETKFLLGSIISIDEKGMIQSAIISQALQKETTSNNSFLSKLEYQPILSFLEMGHKGQVKAADLVSLMAHSSKHAEDAILDIKFMAFALDYVHKAKSTVNFFETKAGLERSPIKFEPARDLPKMVRALGTMI
jgi:hypothetical protein